MQLTSWTRRNIAATPVRPAGTEQPRVDSAWSDACCTLWRLSVSRDAGDGGFSLSRRSGGFDKGRWPVRWSSDRAGFWPARISSIWAIARVPLSNPLRLRAEEELRPLRSLRFRASRPALAPPLRERQRELRRARRVGGASGPAGRLETVQKVCTDPFRHRSGTVSGGLSDPG